MGDTIFWVQVRTVYDLIYTMGVAVDDSIGCLSFAVVPEPFISDDYTWRSGAMDLSAVVLFFFIIRLPGFRW